ncbi:MAG: pentapeptide repeat-containing protein [Nanoarchaeota archaeon]|nr:pentapeptide repeat-containing protein [Nanoarchaeota archaeon]
MAEKWTVAQRKVGQESSVERQIDFTYGQAIKARNALNQGNYKTTQKRLRDVDRQCRRLEWRGGGWGLRHLPDLDQVEDLKTDISTVRAAAKSGVDHINNYLGLDKLAKRKKFAKHETKLTAIKKKKNELKKDIVRDVMMAVNGAKRANDIADAEPWMDLDIISKKKKHVQMYLKGEGYYQNIASGARVAHWNSWWFHVPRRLGLDTKQLSCLDLDEADLREIDLSGANLDVNSFRNANLTEANFKHCHLKDAYFDGDKTDCSRAKFVEAWMQGCHLSEVNMTGADLTKAHMWNANLTFANLTGANLNETELVGAWLRGADLTRANLIGTDLRDAHMHGVNFKNTTLKEVNVQGADLEEAENLTSDQLLAAENWYSTHNIPLKTLEDPRIFKALKPLHKTYIKFFKERNPDFVKKHIEFFEEPELAKKT